MFDVNNINIAIVGVGGAGNNTLTRVHRIIKGQKEEFKNKIKGRIKSIAINTDTQDLLLSDADYKVLIGEHSTRGRGAGNDISKGFNAMLESADAVKKHLKGANLVFITGGMGGGTATLSSSLVAEWARQQGAIAVAVVTVPFSAEGLIRYSNAVKGVQALLKSADTTIVIQNDRLAETVPTLPLNLAFRFSDEVLSNAIIGITDVLFNVGLVNLDLADISNVMKNKGIGLMGFGESGGRKKVVNASSIALENPLLNTSVKDAEGIFVHIAGGNDMTLMEAHEAVKTIVDNAPNVRNIVWGAEVRKDLKGKMRVLIIATGMKELVLSNKFRDVERAVIL